MIDNGWAIKWDVATAVKRCVAFDDYNVTWSRSRFGGWDPEGYATLRSKTKTLIAYGEKEWTLEALSASSPRGTVDVVGVDPGRAEGITGFLKVASRVEFYRPAVERPRLVVRDLLRREPRRQLQQPLVQSSSSSSRSATRCSTSSDQALRARERLGLPADRTRPRHRGDRGSRRPLPKREGPREGLTAAPAGATELKRGFGLDARENRFQNR